MQWIKVLPPRNTSIRSVQINGFMKESLTPIYGAKEVMPNKLLHADSIQLSLLLVGALWAVFGATSLVSKKRFKETLGSTLVNSNPGLWLTSCPHNISRFFSAVFGDKHFSINCFFRSSIASICWVLLFFFSGLAAHRMGLGSYINTWRNAK